MHERYTMCSYHVQAPTGRICMQIIAPGLVKHGKGVHSPLNDA